MFALRKSGGGKDPPPPDATFLFYKRRSIYNVVKRWAQSPLVSFTWRNVLAPGALVFSSTDNIGNRRISRTIPRTKKRHPPMPLWKMPV